MNNDLFKTLKDLTLNPEIDRRGFVVREVFKDSYNYMKNGTLIRQVVNKINEVDFNRAEDRHLFGDIYEQILRDLQSAGNAGEYLRRALLPSSWWIWSIPDSVKNSLTLHAAQEDSLPALSTIFARTM